MALRMAQGEQTRGYNPVVPCHACRQGSPQQQASAGVVLATTVPLHFAPLKSAPKKPGEPPFQRLVLISSRVHQCMQVTSGAWA